MYYVPSFFKLRYGHGFFELSHDYFLRCLLITLFIDWAAAESFDHCIYKLKLSMDD